MSILKLTDFGEVKYYLRATREQIIPDKIGVMSSHFEAD